MRIIFPSKVRYAFSSTFQAFRFHWKLTSMRWMPGYATAHRVDLIPWHKRVYLAIQFAIGNPRKSLVPIVNALPAKNTG